MKRTVFPVNENDGYKRGDFVLVEVTDATQNTLFADPIGSMSIDDYFKHFNGDRTADYNLAK